MEKTKQFLREHKMLVATSGVVILIAIIIAVMVIMSKPETPVSNTEGDVIESGITEVTESLSSADENYLQDINKAPENTEDSNTKGDVDKDNIDEFTEDTESDTDVSTENPDEDTKVDNSESITKPDEEDTSSETKEPEETTSSESSTTVVPPVVEEPVTPPVKEEPVTPPPVTSTVPSVSWDGGGITLGTLGITIPTLRDFNDEALTDNTNNTFWTGDNNDVATAQTLADTLTSVRNAVINAGALNAKTGQGFAVEQYSISWDWASYSSNHDFQLKRDPNSKVYTLIIKCPLDSYVTSMGIDVTNYNRDIVLAMCSIFSSQPQTVYSTLYEDLYGTECISMTSYTSVGDCKIKYDNSQSYDGHYVYLIK